MSTTLRIRDLLAPHAARFALALLLGVLALLAAFGLLAFSGHFITAAAVAGGSAASAFAFDIFRPGALIRLFAIVRTAGRYGERLVSHDAVLRLLEGLRGRLYAALVALTPEPLARWSDGELLQRLVGDVERLDEAPLRALLPLAGAAIIAGVAFAVAVIADPRFAAPVATALLIAAVVVPFATARRSLRDGRVLAGQAGARRDGLIDALRGLTTLSLCGAWPAWRDAWLAQDRALLAAQVGQRLRESVGQAVALLAVGAGAWALVVLANTGGAGPAAPWNAAAVLGVLASAEALAPLTAAWLSWGRARAAAQRLTAVIATPPEMTWPSCAELPVARGALDVRNAGYCYREREAGLAPLSLSLAAGARLVVRGASGAGKSTLAALLVRSIDPDVGEVRLDGVDLRDYDEASLRARIALLPQRPHLFAASIAENLRVADADADDARLRDVLRTVALDEWLGSLPQGLQTPLGEYGIGLSGGEARRLALARTLLRRAVVFVLDEPFEGLDAALRARVADGIDRWAGAASVVLISHDAAVFDGRAAALRLTPRRAA